MQDKSPRRNNAPRPRARQGSPKARQSAPAKPFAAKASSRAARAARTSGLITRRLAVSYIRAVLVEGRQFDDVIAKAMRTAPDQDAVFAQDLEQRDRAMARLIAATVLRRKGQIDDILRAFLAKPLDVRKGNIWAILQAAAAQLLFLGTKPHAAINIAVEQCRSDRGAHRFAGLANAVLRKVAAKGAELVAAQNAAKLNTPNWLWLRWVKAYGEDTARAIADANRQEAALDISLKRAVGRSADHELLATWAERLQGQVLAIGSIRRAAAGRIEDLPGFAEGEWWVQDAAATLPAKLLGDVSGKQIADVCAAPGGKTAQLVAAGARVTAVDSSAHRLQRLNENLERLQLSAQVVQADARSWAPAQQFDAILLDAPCTATGTMRRHPDIAHLKQAGDVERLAELQSCIIDNVIKHVRPGGTLLYCTCSLEPEEGVRQIERLLQRQPRLRRQPVTAAEISGEDSWVTREGDLRTFPFHMPLDGGNGAEAAGNEPQSTLGSGGAGPAGTAHSGSGSVGAAQEACLSTVSASSVPAGLDGFFAARLIVAQ